MTFVWYFNVIIVQFHLNIGSGGTLTWTPSKRGTPKGPHQLNTDMIRQQHICKQFGVVSENKVHVLRLSNLRGPSFQHSKDGPGIINPKRRRVEFIVLRNFMNI